MQWLLVQFLGGKQSGVLRVLSRDDLMRGAVNGVVDLLFTEPETS